MDIKGVPYQVRYHWGAGTSLWKLIVMANDLGNYCRNILVQAEILIFDQESTHPAKIDTAKEIVQINIEYITTGNMCSSIGHDGVMSFKAMGNA